MKWILAADKKPTHNDQVIAAMWRPELDDYCHWIAKWENGAWREWGDDDFYDDMEKNCGYEIIYWCQIKEPSKPSRDNTEVSGGVSRPLD